ncbi:MAG TPA: 50S ribosomal protein L15 [Desulfatiglandales bacterium]|nr:50S ribosomal protein L15 [Desulfatiglandales bacterium]
MRIHDLSPRQGSKKNRKRVGRGVGSGHGRTSCRGHKGQKARSGGTIVPGFEGGQMPLQRRLPKRGFINIFRKEMAVVNVKDLNRFEASAVVDLEALKNAGLVRRAEGEVKVLGKGDLAQALTVKVNEVSKTAKEKIESAGGKVELL